MALPDISPEWWQVAFTGILVAITALYALFTYVIAKSNKKMALASAKQIEYFENEKYRRVIVDMAKNIYWKIHSLLNSTKDSLNSNYHFHPKVSVIVEFPSITPILKSQVHLPDDILKRYYDEIFAHSKRYDQYIEQKDKILNRILEKTPYIWDNYVKLCEQKVKEWGDSYYANRSDFSEVYVILLTSIEIPQTNIDYNFIEKYKDELIDFLNENGFSEDIEEYKILKEEFIQFIDEFLQLLEKLILDWQREYKIINPEFKES